MYSPVLNSGVPTTIIDSIVSGSAPPLASRTVETWTSVTVAIAVAFVNTDAVFAAVLFVTT